MATFALLCGCGSTAPLPRQTGNSNGSASQSAAHAGWSLQSEPTGTKLALVADGATVIRLACAAKQNRLSVTLPAFRPIGSEERLSFGGGSEVIALVADTAGDRELGGVTGTGSVPDDLKQLVTMPMSASYGAQTSGPHSPPPDNLAGPFLSACAEALTAARVAETKPTPATSPCHVQDGELLRIPKQKALGTEPFWAATVDGRCVTYATPDNQKGTRIWTKVESGPMGPVWTGNYEGHPFVLRIQPASRCSDGMSDRVHDLEAVLSVAGEERKGCAMEP